MARHVSEGGALTAADLHLDDDEDNDDDDDGTEYTDRTDDDSFLENSSLRKMMKNSLQMLESLTDEMQKELSRDADTSKTKPVEGPPKLRMVTPSSAASSQQNDPGDDRRFKDMTIRVEFTSNANQKVTSSYTPANDSVLTTSSPLASPMTSPIYAAAVKDATNATKLPTLEDDIPTPKHDPTDHMDDLYDDLSLDESLANEMKALKQVALEIERELQSTDSHTVQEAIERIGNSQDPHVKGILESEDKVIIRKILDEEIQRNEPKNKLLRYLYKAVMNTLTEEETTHLLVAVASLVWSIVLGLVFRDMTVEVKS
jgi:hypothetical protein